MSLCVHLGVWQCVLVSRRVTMNYWTSGGGRVWASSVSLPTSSFCFTRHTMVCTSAIAPWPSSPQINLFVIGGTSSKPKLRSDAMCCEVRGCVHIIVFIAGQKRRGFEKSQARATHVYIINRGNYTNYKRIHMHGSACVQHVWWMTSTIYVSEDGVICLFYCYMAIPWITIIILAHMYFL